MITPCIFGDVPWCLGWLAEKLLFPAMLAGVVAWFAVRQLKKKRAIDFADKQLSEFYAPMLGARSEIVNHTKFDNHMRDASRHEDRKRLERDAERPIDHLLLGDMKNYEGELELFFAHINRRLLKERIDAYVAMRDLFARKMAYADRDTREWYEYFYAFVEMWRVLRDDDVASEKFLPRGVGGALGGMFDEALLEPFYDHLRDRCDLLQREIAGERGTKTPAPKPPEVRRRPTLDDGG